MKFFLLFFLFLSATVYPLQLIERMREAQERQYVVLKQDKTFSFLSIVQKNSDTIVFEEISLPEKASSKEMNWKEWYLNDAKGYTNWIEFEMNLSDGKVLSAYSISDQKHLTVHSDHSFIQNLLFLSFTKVPDHHRKRLGSKNTFKTIWNPPLVIEGEKITNVPISAWKATWPRDRSDLSGKEIEVYLIDDTKNFSYPVCFPLWIEVSNKYAHVKTRSVELGLINL